MAYVEGYLVPVKKTGIDAYTKAAQDMALLFKEYGALSIMECVADDAPYGELTSFPRAVQQQEDETVFFSWIVFPSKEVRDAAHKRMMEDPRMAAAWKSSDIDGKRMVYGGFKPVVDVK